MNSTTPEQFWMEERSYRTWPRPFTADRHAYFKRTVEAALKEQRRRALHAVEAERAAERAVKRAAAHEAKLQEREAAREAKLQELVAEHGTTWMFYVEVPEELCA
jgi:hypothetical protein